MASSSPITQVSRGDDKHESLITQVSRDGSSTGAENPKKKKGFFASFCSCFSSSSSPEPVDDTQRHSPKPVVPQQHHLLRPLTTENLGKKTLVLDLDETLVHSSFKPVPNADFVIPVEIDNTVHQVYVLKRPGVDQFLISMAVHFELVVFTASLAKYADPVLDLLDKDKVIGSRLFREDCTNHKGNYVKDLARLGRDIRHVIIIDNSPASYLFHPENAVPIDSWFDDENDTELLDLIPFLEDMTKVDNVMSVLDTSHRS
eukprot:TRINITY_DN1198_c2_g1_i2.p1 TRINITY_DN1198_c2_g1~~TRINITY_DN1198_c2_g1_i2.p1  ORF type:complete len:259 (+),score=60.92 TRINITY_DN1198_c2_g1_i2:220-996(+)